MHVLFEKEEGMCGSTACCTRPFRKAGDDLQRMHLMNDLVPPYISWKHPVTLCLCLKLSCPYVDYV